jgi:hypothetical protein
MTRAEADVVQLRLLVDAYASAVDDGDGDGMAALFVPGGELLVYEAETGEQSFAYRGPAELATVAAEMRRLYVRTFHFIGNFACTVDGDRATGRPYCIAYPLRDDGRGPQVVTMPVRYDDTYLRTSDGWRFEQRICTVQWRERRLAIQWPP